jgi:hypothetical protein
MAEKRVRPSRQLAFMLFKFIEQQPVKMIVVFEYFFEEVRHIANLVNS